MKQINKETLHYQTQDLGFNDALSVESSMAAFAQLASPREIVTYLNFEFKDMQAIAETPSDALPDEASEAAKSENQPEVPSETLLLEELELIQDGNVVANVGGQQVHHFTSSAGHITPEASDGLLVVRFDLKGDIEHLVDFLTRIGGLSIERAEFIEIFRNFQDDSNPQPPTLPVFTFFNSENPGPDLDEDSSEQPTPDTPLGEIDPEVEVSGLFVLEDNSVSLNGTLSIAPLDTLISVVISGIPEGVIVRLGDQEIQPNNGTIVVNSLEDYNALSFQQSSNSNEDFDLTFVATVQGLDEQFLSNPPVTATVFVAPVVDGVSLTAEDTTTLEDEAVSLDEFTVSLIDLDGSESAETLLVIIDPELGSLSIEILGETFVSDPLTGELEIPINLDLENPEQVVEGLTVIPTGDFSGDIPLLFQVITTDVDSENIYLDSVILQEFTQTVSVQPVVDQPNIVIEDVSTDEDVIVQLPEPDIEVTDTDGSESFDSTFILFNIPDGAQIFLGDPSEPSSQLLNPNGETSIEINTADRGNLFLVATPESGDDFILTYRFSVTDVKLDEPSITDNEFFDTDVQVTLNAVVDGASIVINEPVVQSEDIPFTLPDIEISFGSDVAGTSGPDLDGSESISVQVLFESDPITLEFPDVVYLNGDFTYDDTTGILTITDGIAPNADNTPFILSGIEVTPAADSDVDLDIIVRTTTTDLDSDDSSTDERIQEEAFTIQVAPSVDGVTISADPQEAVAEDTLTELNPVTITLGPDLDGSESVTTVRVEIIQGSGTLSYSGALESIINPDGSLTLFVSDGNLLDLNNSEVILEDIFVDPTEDTSQDIIVRYTVTTNDLDTEGLSPDDTITQTFDQTLQIDAVVEDDTQIAFDDVVANEDEVIQLSAPTVLSTTDVDGSEAFAPTFELSGIPDGTQIYLGDPNDGGILQSVSAGSLTLNLTDLGNIFIIPAAQSDVDIPLEYTFTVIDTDADGDPAFNDQRDFTATQTVLIAPVVDGVTISGFEGSTIVEDNALILNDVTITLGPDLDGSETAANAVFTLDPNLGALSYFDGTSTFVSDNSGVLTIPINLEGTNPATTLSGIAFTPASDASQNVDITLDVETIDTDTEGLQSNSLITQTQTVTVVINPVADPFEIALPEEITVDEDDPFTLPAVTLTTGEAQNAAPDSDDGSETVGETFILSGIPDGTVVTVDGVSQTILTSDGSTPIAFNSGSIPINGNYLILDVADQNAGLIEITPPSQDNSNFDLQFFYSVLDNNGIDDDDAPSTIIQSETVTVRLGSVVDGVTIEGSNAQVVVEDEENTTPTPTVTLDDVTISLGDDLDGSESATIIIEFDQGGVIPSDVTVAGGVYDPTTGILTINDLTVSNNPLIVSGIQVFLDPNSDEDLTYTITAEVTDADADPGDPDVVETFTETFTVTVAADADPATVPDFQDQTVLVETPFQLDLSGIQLNDSDGSEVLAVQIEGLPNGATITLPDSTVITIGVDVPEDTPVEIPTDQLGLIEITINADEDSIGTFPITITATATEQADGTLDPDQVFDQEEVVVDTFDLTVLPVQIGNGPGVPGTNETDPLITDEDTALSIPVIQSDNPQIQITSIEISGIPEGATLQVVSDLDLDSGAVATPAWTLVAGTSDTYQFTGTSTESSTFIGSLNINTLDTLQVIPAEDSDTNFELTFEYTLASGFIGIDIVPIVVNVDADPPVNLSAAFLETVVEDEFSELSIAGELKDTDGSEEITSIVISGVPVGSTFALDAAGTQVVGTANGTTWTFTAQELDSLLNDDNSIISGSLFFRPPTNWPTDSDTSLDFNYQVNVTDTASEAEDTVPSDTASANLDIPAPQTQAVTEDYATNPPAPELTVIEDNTLTINPTDFLLDQDGSEVFVNTITLGDIPVGTIINGVEITAGTLTIPAADFDGLLITPPADSDDDFTLTIQGEVQDSPGTPFAGAIVNYTSTFTVNVEADADMPILTVTPADPPVFTGDIPGTENTGTQVLIEFSLSDTDGSETLSNLIVTDLPEGAEFVDASGNQVGARQPDGSWIFPTDLATESNVNGGDLFVRWIDQDNSEDISFTAAITSIETNLTSANQSATASASATVVITPELDQTRLESVDKSTFEDQPVTLGSLFNISSQESSENVISYQISVFDENGDPLSVTFANLPDGSVSGSDITIGFGSVYDVSVFSDVEIQLAEHDSQNYRVDVSATVVDQELPEGEADTEVISATSNVTVIGVADDVALFTEAGGSVDDPTVIDQTGTEDTPITISASDITQVDPSEILTVEFEFPAGVSATGPGVTQIDTNRYILNLSNSSNEIQITPPEDLSGDFTFDVKVTTTEEDGDSNTVFYTLNYDLAPVVDDVEVATDAVLIEDAGPQAANISLTLQDVDGSESIQGVTITSVTSGATLSYIPDGDTDPIAYDIGITGALSETEFASLLIQPAAESNEDIDLELSIERDDNGVIGTQTALVTLPVQGVSDPGTPNLIQDFDNSSLIIEPDFVDNDDSEDHFLILENLPTDYSIQLSPTSSGPAPVYLGDGKWLFLPDPNAPTQAEEFDYLSDLQFTVANPDVASIVRELNLVSVAREDDGDYQTGSSVAPIEPGFLVAIPASSQLPDPLGAPVNSTVDEDNAIDISTITPPIVADPPITSTVIIYNLPEGFIVENGEFFEAGTVSAGTPDLSGGFWVVDQSELSSIIPPEDFSGILTFDYQVTLSQVRDISSSQTFTNNTVTINPVVDDAEMISDAEGLESGAIPLNLNLNVGDGDTDDTRGVETLAPGSDLIFTDIPQGYSILVDGVVVGTSAGLGDTITVTLPAGSSEIPNISLSGNSESNADFVLNVSYEVQDFNSDLGITEVRLQSSEIPVTVNSDVQLPQVNLPSSFSIPESNGVTSVPLNITLNAPIPDSTDGSQTLRFELSGIPDGVVLSVGSNQGEGIWLVEAADIESVEVIIPPNFGQDFQITVTTIGSDFDADNGSIIFASATEPSPIIFDLDADPSNPGIASSDLRVDEDQSSSYAIPLLVSSPDIDGSETFDIVISGFPANVTFNLGSFNSANGTWEILNIAATDLDLLETLEISPEANFSGQFTLSYDITSTDNAIQGTTQSITSEVIIAPVADPLVFTSSVTVDEDSMNVPIPISLSDIDGSESVDSVIISGFEDGTTFSIGSLTAPGEWTITDPTQADLSSLTTTPPQDFGGTFVLNYQYTVRDSASGLQDDVENLVGTTTIDVTPIADAPNLSVGPDQSDVEVNGSINLSSLIMGSLNDTDGSETLSYLISDDDDPEFTLSLGTEISPGVWEVSSSDVESGNLTFTGEDVKSYNLEIEAIATESLNGDITSVIDSLNIDVVAPVA